MPSIRNAGYRRSSAVAEDAKLTKWHPRHVYVRHYIGVELQRAEGYHEDTSRDTLLCACSATEIKHCSTGAEV